MSRPYRPYHAHDEVQLLRAGEVVDLDVEIWPTCIVVPRGYRVGLPLRGRDYELSGPASTLSNMKNPMKGGGPFVHDDPVDRPMDVFGGQVSVHLSEGHAACITLPIIPKE